LQGDAIEGQAEDAPETQRVNQAAAQATERKVEQAAAPAAARPTPIRNLAGSAERNVTSSWIFTLFRITF
jgi:hypothetical protein